MQLTTPKGGGDMAKWTDYEVVCDCGGKLLVSKCPDCEHDSDSLGCDTCEGHGFLDGDEPCDIDECMCHACYYAEHW